MSVKEFRDIKKENFKVLKLTPKRNFFALGTFCNIASLILYTDIEIPGPIISRKFQAKKINLLRTLIG